MWSRAAAFYSGELNPPTCLLYLHSLSGPERQKPSVTHCLTFLPKSLWWAVEGLMAQVSMAVVCVYVSVHMQTIKHKHSVHLCCSISCSNEHRHFSLEWTFNTYFTAQHTPITCLCFHNDFHTTQMPHASSNLRNCLCVCVGVSRPILKHCVDIGLSRKVLRNGMRRKNNNQT